MSLDKSETSSGAARMRRYRQRRRQRRRQGVAAVTSFPDYVRELEMLVSRQRLPREDEHNREKIPEAVAAALDDFIEDKLIPAGNISQPDVTSVL